MSEYRKPKAYYSVRCADKHGKKTPKNCTLIEVFKAELFETKWGVFRELVFPKPFLHSPSRKAQLKTLYRVRVDGKWYTAEAKYTLLTQEQIIDKWIRW